MPVSRPRPSSWLVALLFLAGTSIDVRPVARPTVLGGGLSWTAPSPARRGRPDGLAGRPADPATIARELKSPGPIGGRSPAGPILGMVPDGPRAGPSAPTARPLRC